MDSRLEILDSLSILFFLLIPILGISAIILGVLAIVKTKKRPIIVTLMMILGFVIAFISTIIIVRELLFRFFQDS
jgi:undecaprenyl pyrophosphate phosphatase UppP